jgi:hypothetical protein
MVKHDKTLPPPSRYCLRQQTERSILTIVSKTCQALFQKKIKFFLDTAGLSKPTLRPMCWRLIWAMSAGRFAGERREGGASRDGKGGERGRGEMGLEDAGQGD